MTELLDHTSEQVRDFTKRRKIQFRIDHYDETPDVYQCVPAIPAMLMVDFVAKLDAASGATNDLAAQTQVFTEIFSIILPDAEATRFLGRMRDKDDPIDLGQVMDIVQYVMGEYGLRPTTPSEPSAEPSASPEPGTSSAASSSSAPDSTPSD